MTFAPIQNRLGVQPVGTTVTCVNKSGTSVAIGDLVITSFIHAGAVVDPQQAANTGYVFNCIRKAVSTETGNTGYLGVVTGLMAGAGGNGREVEVQFGGICSVKVLVTSTVTPGTLLGVSSTAGVLTNSSSVLSPGGYSVTLMDNAAVADGTALKRVYIPVEYTFDSGGNSFAGPQVYGNNRAGRFLKDLIAGTNSLDVVILGDSNTGSSIGGGWGYQAGMSQALNNLNANCYGTPIAPFIDRSNSGAARFYGVWRGTVSTINKSADYKSGLSATVGSSTNASALPYAVWNSNTVLTNYGSSTIQGTLTSVVITSNTGDFSCAASNLQVGQPVAIYGTFGGGGSITGYTNPTTAATAQYYYIIATNGSTTFTLSNTYGGAFVVTTNGTPTGLTYGSNADFSDWLYLPTTNNLYNTSGVNLAENHPLSTNGVVQYLRVRYGKVPSGGQLKPNVWTGGSVNAVTLLLSGTTTSLSAASGQPTFDLYEESFTANGKGHNATAIGYNHPSGTVFSYGPGALFCQSLYRQIKGWAVHSHAYQSGDDSTKIARVVTDTSTTYLSYLLRETRERQIAAGGTGRVMLFVHSGINGADTGATFTAAHIALWNKYKAVWSSLGYPETDLAIVSIVGVQKDSADTSGSGSTGNLIAVRAAANQMALANQDMTVVDVKSLMSYNAMTTGTGTSSYYQKYKNSPLSGSDITVHLSGGGVQTTSAFTATVTTATSITLTGTSLIASTGYWVGSTINIGTIGMVGVVITATTGVFTCTTMGGNLTVNQQINISGTNTGGGTVTNGTYYITATNGTTQFTLSAAPGGASITTTAGTPIGLTFTYYGNSAYQPAIITEYTSAGVATVNQWVGGQPATGHNISYTINQVFPSDGYTVVSQAILSSLIS